MEKQPSDTATSEKEDKEQKNQFAEDLGRLFEIGFNTGFLTAIYQHKKVKTHFGDLYTHDLGHLRLQGFLNKMYEHTGIVNQVDKEILRRWILYFFQKGYLAGLNLFTEYLQSFENQRKGQVREVVYLQCNFYGQNSLYTYSSKNDKAAVQDLMKQFQSFGQSMR